MIIRGNYNNIVSRNNVKKTSLININKDLTLPEFYNKRNKVLILRGVGGLGDILMHRMMFEDMKQHDIELHFACPKIYHPAIIDHPYVDKVIDSNEVNISDYIVSYNTTTACGRYEMKLAPLSNLHRSDIWSQHCGINLINHNMHITLTNDEKEEGYSIIQENRDREGPVVIFCPISAMDSKNLLDFQVECVVKNLREKGCCVIGLHKHPIMNLLKNDVPSIHSLSIRQWMAVINASDYVVSVDTSSFHCAGGLSKPLTGIFTFADGLVYGKYFNFELIQKHRKTNPCWNCGPCYNWSECTKTKEKLKPCLTEISVDEIVDGLNRMFVRWPIT